MNLTRLSPAGSLEEAKRQARKGGFCLGLKPISVGEITYITMLVGS
jgi:hypothetical protein